jgi:putative transposase
MGYGCDLYRHSARLGISIHHSGFVRWLHLLSELVLGTLKQAKQREQVTNELIVHSDRGYQYTSHSYATLLHDYAITPSRSRPGNCWDNAPMENFFGHLKEEALRQFPVPSFQEAKQIIDDYIHFDNYERIQLKTRQTPFETRCLSS